MRKILDAALAEFGTRGFSDSSIVGITRRARVALGTFYTYFDSKEAVFQALVRDMSARVRDHVAPSLEGATDQLDAERRALAAYLDFVVGHKEVYRIIDEAEFVDPEGFRRHYVTTAERIAARLRAARERGEFREAPSPIDDEVQAWAIMGMNVFLGLRFGVWGGRGSRRWSRKSPIGCCAKDLPASQGRPPIRRTGRCPGRHDRDLSPMRSTSPRTSVMQPLAISSAHQR